MSFAVEAGASHQSVCALVGGSSNKLDAALGAQGRQPEAVLRQPGSFRTGLDAALETGATWVWVLDGSVAPRPNALHSLLGALDRVDELPDPAILVGVVRAADGTIEPGRAIWYRRNQIEPAMAAVARRLLPVRATAGPVLVRRGAIEAEPPPPDASLSPSVELEWTARTLRERTGYLVPESESDALGVLEDPLAQPLTAARLMFGGAFARLDRARILYELAERIGTRLTASGSAGPRPLP